MGILDDAIREHLELKRQHGAADDDLERLEKEAFGPPTRPGDPEFDTSEGQAAAPAASGADTETAPPSSDLGPPSTAPDLPAVEPSDAGAASTEPESGPAAADEPATEAAPASSGGLFDAEADSGDDDWLASLEEVVEQPVIDTAAEPEAEAAGPEVESTTSPIEDLTPAERARIEHADLGDTVDHPAVPAPETGEETFVPPPETGEEPVGAAPETGESAAPPEPPESAIFDQGEGEFGDLDLDLDDAEFDEPGPAPAGSTTSTEMDALPGEPVTGEDEYVADDDEEDELEDEDEDLLEETPDFLQDTPEGERLWFEQGAPKDFDFDDEDEDD